MKICFVLVNPAVPENVGAAARAIKTMGFGELRIVDSAVHREKSARILAHGAGEILDSVLEFSSLEEALDDIDLAIGTSAKRRLGRRYSFSARELPEQLSGKSHLERVAVVFGCEESGLSNEQLSHCDMLSYVPLAVTYPSLNLGQAVMIYAYSLSELSGEALPSTADSSAERKADPAQWRALTGRVESFFDKLSVPRHSKLYRWAQERLALAGESDVKFLHLLLQRLEPQLSAASEELSKTTPGGELVDEVGEKQNHVSDSRER